MISVLADLNVRMQPAHRTIMPNPQLQIFGTSGDVSTLERLGLPAAIETQANTLDLAAAGTIIYSGLGDSIESYDIIMNGSVDAEQIKIEKLHDSEIADEYNSSECVKLEIAECHNWAVVYAESEVPVAPDADSLQIKLNKAHELIASLQFHKASLEETIAIMTAAAAGRSSSASMSSESANTSPNTEGGHNKRRHKSKKAKSQHSSSPGHSVCLTSAEKKSIERIYRRSKNWKRTKAVNLSPKVRETNFSNCISEGNTSLAVDDADDTPLTVAAIKRLKANIHRAVRSNGYNENKLDHLIKKLISLTSSAADKASEPSTPEFAACADTEVDVGRTLQFK